MPVPKEELPRKIVHLSLGSLFCILILGGWFYLEIFIPLLLAGIVLSFIVRWTDLPLITPVLDRLDRDDERAFLPGLGVISFFLGSILSVMLFQREVAFLAVATLTFGDPLARLIGEWVGRISSPLNRKKKIEGHLAVLPLLTLLGMEVLPWWAVVPGVTVGMLWEMVDTKGGGARDVGMLTLLLDDDLTLPLVTGSVTSLFLLLNAP